MLSLMLITLIQPLKADTLEDSAKEKLPEFLSQVIGLDFSKYYITEQGYSINYPSNFGGIVKEEHLIIKLESNNSTAINSKLEIGSIINNGYPFWININQIGSIIYQPTFNRAF